MERGGVLLMDERSWEHKLHEEEIKKMMDATMPTDKEALQEEVWLYKTVIDRLLTAITRGHALSDIQRMSAKLAVQVNWPYIEEIGSGEEE